jgi:DNA ligase-1
MRIGANWRSVVGPLGKASLIHRAGPGWAARLDKSRLDAAAAAAGARLLSAAFLGCKKGSALAWAELSSCASCASVPHHAMAPPLPPLPPAVAAFQTCPNLGVLASALLTAGPGGLASACALRPGVPVQPMLANPATGVGQALKKLGPGVDVLAEMKYDGKRAQMHVVSATEVCARGARRGWGGVGQGAGPGRGG